MILRAVVGLGANLGERLTTMRAAAGELGRVARVEKTSRVYRTAPWGVPSQGEYLNAAALVRYDGAPTALMESLLAIEASLGRIRTERWAARVIDLDLLWIEGTTVQSETLVVPHPRLRERAFALVPLLEIVPDARDPRTGDPYVVPPGEVWDTHETL